MSGSAQGTTRRRLLIATGAATAGAACSTAPSGMTPPGPDVGVVPESPFLELDAGIPQVQPGMWRALGTDVGAVADFPLGSWRYNAGVRAVIARDARGYYAYSAICSHERCLLNPPDERGGTVCPCHGSTFDGEGRVTTGPAVSNLRRFAVRVAAGRVFVDVAVRVADDVRAAPEEPDAGTRDATTDTSTGDAPGDARDTGTTDTGTDTGPRDTGVDPCMGVDVGPVSGFRAGTWTRLMAQRLVIARDARGLFAYSARCTHSGCVIGAPDDVGLATCGCHGSQFDGNGQVVRGPAGDPLDHYAVAICRDRVIVRTGEIVADNARTPLP